MKMISVRVIFSSAIITDAYVIVLWPLYLFSEDVEWYRIPKITVVTFSVPNGTATEHFYAHNNKTKPFDRVTSALKAMRDTKTLQCQIQTNKQDVRDITIAI